MSIFVGESRISRKNFFNRSSLISLDAAWTQLQPLIGDKSYEPWCRLLLCQWRGDVEVRRYESFTRLAVDMKAKINESVSGGTRENYFFQLGGENINIDTVIYRTVVATSSIGWTQVEFFRELGDPFNTRWYNDHITSKQLSDWLTLDFVKSHAGIKSAIVQGLRRRAEQEYLMQNMVKGALFEAAEVADEFNVGISVRGTGLLAHMGIESGDPTKAQEFKNKTSKDVDLVLCSEMDWGGVGAVVHYDPRVEWNSRDAQIQSDLGNSPMFRRAAGDSDWQKKKLTLDSRLGHLGKRFKRPSDDALKSAFTSRSKEYMEEDHEYRKGHYAPFTTLVGPYVRLKVRSDVNMVGDHDLFAFTEPAPEHYGVFMRDTDVRVAQAQKALQNKPTFQAQHGGIWYWQPGTTFNRGIKAKIMGSHGPEGDEPLVYIRPGKQVTAAYYTPQDKLASVWSDKGWTKWMKKTHSGELLLNPVASPSTD